MLIHEGKMMPSDLQLFEKNGEKTPPKHSTLTRTETLVLPSKVEVEVNGGNYATWISRQTVIHHEGGEDNYTHARQWFFCDTS